MRHVPTSLRWLLFFALMSRKQLNVNRCSRRCLTRCGAPEDGGRRLKSGNLAADTHVFVNADAWLWCPQCWQVRLPAVDLLKSSTILRNLKYQLLPTQRRQRIPQFPPLPCNILADFWVLFTLCVCFFKSCSLWCLTEKKKKPLLYQQQTQAAATAEAG